MKNDLKCCKSEMIKQKYGTEKNRNFKKFATKNPKIAQKNRKT